MKTVKDSESQPDPRRDPRARGSTPGPGGERARAIRQQDVPATISLLAEALGQSSSAMDSDRLEWLSRTLATDPTRGILILAEVTDANRSSPLGVGCITSQLSLRYGITGFLYPFYVRVGEKHTARAQWFLSEILELARYHGINHLVAEPGDSSSGDLEVFKQQQFTELRPGYFEILLRPHFDDLSGPGSSANP